MSFAVHKKDGKTGSANIVSVVICALHYIIAGVIIVNQNSIWRFLDTAGAYFNEITALILTGAVVISMILNLYLHRKRKNAVKFMAVGLVCVYMSIFGVLNNFLAFYYFEFVLTAVMIGIYYFICNTDQIPEFFRAYRNIILVIAAVSLVMWLLCSVFRLIPYTAKVYTCWTDNGELKRIKSYLGIYFEPQKITLFGASFRRNCACFAEGPQAGLAFTLGYLIELFLTEKSSKVRLIIFSLAIISTFSVTGIIVMALAFIVWILIKHHAAIRKSNGLKAGLAASGVAILALLVYLVIVKFRSSVSGSVRVDDYKAAIKAWLGSPLIGNGYMNDISIRWHMSPWRMDNTGYSNSIGQIFAHGGLYLGVLYSVPPVIGIVRSVKKRDWMQLCFTAGIIVLLCTNIFTYSYITLFLLYYFAFAFAKTRT